MVMVLVAAIFVLTCVTVPAQYVAPGYTAQPFVVGLNSLGNDPGPVGLVFFEPTNSFYFVEDQTIFRIDNALPFPPGSTPYTKADASISRNTGLFLNDLAIDSALRLWAIAAASAVQSYNLSTLSLLQTINSFGAGAIRDPFSGDVLYNGFEAMYRLKASDSNPQPQIYYPFTALGTDGLGVGPDGSFYVGEATGPDNTKRWISKISGTNLGASGSLLTQYPLAIVLPGSTSTITDLEADGLAIAADGTFIWANCHSISTNGAPSEVVQINLTNGANTVIFSNITYRGDFGKAGPDGCFYFTFEPTAIWQLCGPSPLFQPKVFSSTSITSDAMDCDQSVEVSVTSPAANTTCTGNVKIVITQGTQTVATFTDPLQNSVVTQPLNLPPGAYSITANYVGDAICLPSSASQSLTVTGPCHNFPCEDPNAYCTNAPPPCQNSTAGRTCTCNQGYVGPADASYCKDVDACCIAPCSLGYICVDLPPPAPATAAGRECQADTCLASPCLSPNAICTHTGLNIRDCVCNSGFVGDGDHCFPCPCAGEGGPSGGSGGGGQNGGEEGGPSGGGQSGEGSGEGGESGAESGSGSKNSESGAGTTHTGTTHTPTHTPTHTQAKHG